MLKSYLKQKQTQLMEQQTDFYTPGGIHVYFKDKIENKDIDVEKVISDVESRIPTHLISDVEMIVVGWFKEFEERQINAFYQDAILHVSNVQDDESDMVDDIVHEISHCVEENYNYEIYGDYAIRKEFLQKRKRLHDELWSIGHKTPLSFFAAIEYDKEFDDFLLNTVGYDKLNVVCSGLFINAYAPTSLREYFATSFTEFYMNPDLHNSLKMVSPAVFEKIILLNDVDSS